MGAHKGKSSIELHLHLRMYFVLLQTFIGGKLESFKSNICNHWYLQYIWKHASTITIKL